MERDVPRLRPEQTLREAGLLMQEREVGALPVVDDNDMLIGLLAREALPDRYLEQFQLSEEVDLPVTLLVRTLHATLVTGDAARVLREHAWIATMHADMARRTIRRGDIVLIGDQPDVQRAAIEAGADCLILTDDAPLADAVITAAIAARDGAAADPLLAICRRAPVAAECAGWQGDERSPAALPGGGCAG